MASATRAEPLSAPLAARVLEQAFERADRHRASALGLLGVTAVVGLLGFGADGAPVVHGLLAAWWLLHVAWAVSVRAAFPSGVCQKVEVAVEFVAAFATVGAASAEAELANAVWLIPFARAVAWLPRRPARVIAARWSLIGAHLAVALHLVSTGTLPGAAVIVALLLGQVLTLNVSTQLMQQRLELEAETQTLHAELERAALGREHDRIARELHDGVGADLVALMLALRARGPQVEAFTQQVLTLLEELRSVVWAIRGGRGSLAEFEKLVRARARIALPATHIDTTLPLLQRGQGVEPQAALAMLAAVTAVLERATAPATLTVALEGIPSLAVTLHFPVVEAPDLSTLAPPGAPVSVTANASQIRLELR